MRFALIMAALVALVVFMGFRGTLDHPMQFDDCVYVDGNPFITDSHAFGYPARFVDFANEAARRNLDPDLSASFILRPVCYLTFHINYLIDGLRPRWYRAFNVGLHFINGMLVFGLAGLLLKHAPHGLGRRTMNIPFIAGTACLLFTAHPLATESVTYIVQRFTSMVTMFFLGVLILHFMAVTATDVFRRRVWQTLAALLCFVGMLVKESMFTAPVMAVLLEWSLLRRPLRQAVRDSKWLLLALPVSPVLVVMVTWAQHHGQLSMHDVFHLANVKDMDNPQLHYMITQLTVLVHYLRLILWPSGMNVDPDWTRYHSLLQWPVLKSIAVLLALVGLTGWWFKRSRQDARVRLILAGVVWFFVTVAMSSSLFPLPDLVAEHRAFLPSIGILLAIACALDLGREQLANRSWKNWPACALTGVLAVTLTIATVRRNEVWGSAIRLWEDAAKKAPAKFRVWGNLGAAYACDGRLSESAECYQKAMDLHPRFLTAYKNLARLHFHMGNPEAALNVCIKATKVDPAFGNQVDICYLAGISHLALGRLEPAEALLTAIVKQVPTHQEALVALARLSVIQKRKDVAQVYLHRAALLGPLHAEDQALLDQWITVAVQNSPN